MCKSFCQNIYGGLIFRLIDKEDFVFSITTQWKNSGNPEKN